MVELFEMGSLCHRVCRPVELQPERRDKNSPRGYTGNDGVPFEMSNGSWSERGSEKGHVSRATERKTFMNTRIRVGNTLLTAFLACGLVACSSQGTPSGGTGGSGGVGGGTTTPAGTGGTTAPAGTGGAGTTGTTGAVSTDGKLCLGPTQGLITDFTYAGGTDTTQVHFGDATTLGGGEYVYPTGTDSYPLTSDMSASSWHISGTVGTYSGFGLYFDNCSRIDASAYTGISLMISGTVEQDGMVTFGVDTLDDSITAAWLNSHGSTGATNPGRCNPPADSTLNQYSQSACANPTVSIPVTATPTAQRILWTDFTGGKPESSVTGSDIIAIHWFFPNPPGAGTASPTTYNVDITLDNLSFTQ